MDDLNKIVSWVGKTKGIHYRPHRQNPKKHIVIKIYLKIGKLDPKQTRDILASYLAGINIKPENGIIQGSVKWVAIVDRQKFEAKNKGKVEGEVTQQELLKALTKARAKEKAVAKAKSHVQQTQKNQQFSLGDQGTEIKGYMGKYALDMPGDSTVKQKEKQYVYTLDGKDNIGNLVDEARAMLGDGAAYLEAAPTLGQLRDKTSGSKPWSKTDDETDDGDTMYVYKGAKGVWRTGSDGDRLFVVHDPDTGKPTGDVLGVSQGKQDAMSGQKGMFGTGAKPKKTRADAAPSAPAKKSKEVATSSQMFKDDPASARDAGDAAESAAAKTGKEHVIWETPDGLKVAPYDVKDATRYTPRMSTHGASRDYYALDREGAAAKYPFAYASREKSKARHEEKTKRWNTAQEKFGLKPTTSRTSSQAVTNPETFKAAVKDLAGKHKWGKASSTKSQVGPAVADDGRGMQIVKDGDSYKLVHKASGLQVPGKHRTVQQAKAVGNAIQDVLPKGTFDNEDMQASDWPDEVANVFRKVPYRGGAFDVDTATRLAQLAQVKDESNPKVSNPNASKTLSPEKKKEAKNAASSTVRVVSNMAHEHPELASYKSKVNDLYDAIEKYDAGEGDMDPIEANKKLIKYHDAMVKDLEKAGKKPYYKKVSGRTAFTDRINKSRELANSKTESISRVHTAVLGEAGRTFDQARMELLKFLASQDWKVVGTLKIPHATSPSGAFRLWFKKQAVYFTHSEDTGPYHGGHKFGNARTVSYDTDIRKLTPQQFLTWVRKAFSLEEARQWMCLEEYGSYLDLRHINKDELGLFTSNSRQPAFDHAEANEALQREVTKAADGEGQFFVVGRLVDNGKWDLLRKDGEWARVDFRGFYEPRGVARW